MKKISQDNLPSFNNLRYSSMLRLAPTHFSIVWKSPLQNILIEFHIGNGITAELNGERIIYQFGIRDSQG